MKWEINSPKNEVEIKNRFEVIFPEPVYAKMMAYVDAVDGEISGMGEVQRIGNSYIVKDVWLLKQECSGTSTAIDAVSLADLRAEVFSQGKARDGFQLWWHSHANMDTFWSGTDKATMDMFMQDIDWMLFVVANKKRSVRARVEYRKPVGVVFEDVAVAVQSEVMFDKTAVEAEVKAKVSDKRWSGYTGGFHGKRGGDWSTPPRRDWFDTEGAVTLGGGTDTPADKGDKYWEQLSRKDKRIVRRYTNEESPMCLYMSCQVCQKKSFGFYCQRLRQIICFTCIQGWDEAGKRGKAITYNTKPVDKPVAETDPTPPGMHTQGDGLGAM